MTAPINTNEDGEGRRLSGRKRWLVKVGVAAAATAMAATTVITFQNDDYNDNLAMIHAASIRNTNADNSAYRDTPQSDLVQANHLGPRSDYLVQTHNQEWAFPIPQGGQFRIACEFSHFAYDDPILKPDEPGAAHLHMFFGNTDANAYTTQETLEDSGGSTCNGGEINRSAYWVPAMLDGDGNARIPERIVIYYKGEGLANGENIGVGPGFDGPDGSFDGCCGSKPYERGMRNISPAVPQSVPQQAGNGFLANYKCANNFSGDDQATGVDEIPVCDGDHSINTWGAPYPSTRTVLEMNVKFNTCFDPDHAPADNQSRAVTDWKSWKEPPSGGWFYANCEDAYNSNPPNPMENFPAFEYFVNYVVEPGEDTSDWYLSSDVDPQTITNVAGPSLSNPGGGTPHGDVWWAWDPATNQQWLDNCVNYSWKTIPGQTTPVAVGCGLGYLTDGGPNNQNPVPGPALQRRAEYDTPGTVDKYPLATLFTELCQPLGPAHSFTTDESAAWCKP